VPTARQNVDDAVPQNPEDLRVVLPVPHTSTACAGAAAGVVMRRIAYRAGAYAPGIQEFLFHDLTTVGSGASIERVLAWMHQHGGELHAMGYRLVCRMVTGQRTDAILGWVKEGAGFRGAVLATEYRRLHPSEPSEVPHAVGVTLDRVDAKAPETLVMVDPWPGTTNGARDRGAIPPQLESAHRAQKYGAVILYWAGYS
jgi:hypothetical protein